LILLTFFLVFSLFHECLAALDIAQVNLAPSSFACSFINLKCNINGIVSRRLRRFTQTKDRLDKWIC